MVDLKKDKVSKQLADDGVWVDIPDFASVKLKKWLNKEHSREIVALLDKFREENGLSPTDEIDEDASLQITVMATCKHVIMDWGNDVQEDGKPVPYSEKKGIEVFSDPGWQDVYRNIVSAANERKNYLERKKEAAVKNA